MNVSTPSWSISVTTPVSTPLVPMPVHVILVTISMWMEGPVMVGHVSLRCMTNITYFFLLQTLMSVPITTIFVRKLASIFLAPMFVTAPLGMHSIPMDSVVLVSIVYYCHPLKT